MSRNILVLAITLLGTVYAVLGQTDQASSDAQYWVDRWSRPPVNLFGPEEDAFNQNMQTIAFPWNDHDDPSNPGALDGDAQWLKDHPNVRFYIDGYASSRGELVYNLALSQRRAEWVRQALIQRGISDDRIKLAVGWGQLYPVCAELNDDCWSKNRLVRFMYVPN
jgi:outer membrane protein OmpA-like peptidoglycan-associated protein